MITSLILIANGHVPASQLNRMLALHREQGLDEIVVVHAGLQEETIKADLVKCVPDFRPFSLSKTRNVGARAAKGDFLIFGDVDVHYVGQLHGLVSSTPHPAFRGRWRRDVQSIGDRSVAERYESGPAPMFIRRDLFEKIGGFHEGYVNYGFEDSDFLHKIGGDDCPVVDAGAVHVLDVHRLFPSNEWDRGDGNREIFNARMAKSVEERIAEDVAAFTRRF